MRFTNTQLDIRLCDINVRYHNTNTLREYIHHMIIKLFGKHSFCNDKKLNSLSDDELTKLIYEFAYIKENRL